MRSASWAGRRARKGTARCLTGTDCHKTSVCPFCVQRHLTRFNFLSFFNVLEEPFVRASLLLRYCRSCVLFHRAANLAAELLIRCSPFCGRNQQLQTQVRYRSNKNPLEVLSRTTVPPVPPKVFKVRSIVRSNPTLFSVHAGNALSPPKTCVLIGKCPSGQCAPQPQPSI
jgi:hypothetical protein